MKKTLAIILVLIMTLSMMPVAFAEVNTEWTGTLRIIGPGALGRSGPDGSEDLATGLRKPGYNHLIAEFNKDYPNVTVELTQSPWDNWQAVLQTAAAGGTADILMHGSMLTDIVLDLSDYLTASPEVLEAIAGGPEYYRDPADYSKTIPTGISYVVNPYYACIDTKLFEEWGVEVPGLDWTWEDVLELASQLTGTNPVTGEENFGIWMWPCNNADSWKPYTSYCAAKGYSFIDYNSADKFDAVINYNSEEFISALNYFNELSKYTPTGWLEGMGNDKVNRANNDIAIVFGEGMLSGYTAQLTDGVSERFLFLPLPVNEDQSDSTYSGFCGTNSIAISKNSSNPDLAWEFIKWLITDEDAQKYLVDNLLTVSTTKGTEQMKEMGYTFMEAHEAVMSNFWDSFATTQNSIVDISYGNLQSLFYSSVVEMYNGNATAEETAQAIQDGMDEYQMMN